MSRYRKSYSLFVLCLLLICFKANGQRLRFEQQGIQQGLPASEVYNLLQDSRGYVWVFTEYGMARHNGTHFTPACRNLPFDESIVYAVRRSTRGDMYIANSKAHIYRIKDDSAFLIPGIEEASEKIIANNEVIYDMRVNDSNDIYFSTFLNSYHLLNNKFVLLTGPVHKDTGIINMRPVGSVYFTEQLQLHTSYFLVRILGRDDRPVFEKYFHVAPMTGNRVRLMEDRQYFYLQLREKLYRIGKKDHTIKVAPIAEVMSLNVSPTGNIWAGTKKGLYELTSDFTVLGHYFEACIVTDILFDNDHGAWVSTIEQGVFYCRNTQHAFYNNIPELSGTISMLKKTEHGLFVGTAKGKLMLITPREVRQIALDSNRYEIKDICLFNGEYLVGTKGKVHALSQDLKRLRPREFLSNGNNVNSYGFIPHAPDSLLAITATSISWITKKNYRSITQGYRIGAHNRCIIKLNNGYLVGTSKGLALFTDSLRFSPLHNALKGITITRLRPDDAGNIWICTKGQGVYILRTDNRIEYMDECPSNVVNDVAFGGKEFLLLCTNKGLYRYRRPSRQGQKPWIRLLAQEVSQCELFDGKVFVAAKQGLITLSLNRLSYDFKAPLILESVISGDRVIQPGELLLKYNENDLYFNFAVLAYDHPDCSFRFTLEGPGAVKQFSGNNQLHLQNLSPGSYILYAYALDNTQNISRYSPLKVAFYIKPAFWQTNIFIALTIALVVGLMILLMWLSYRRIRQKEYRKTMVIRELAENKLTALRSQINPHFISNSLTAIQHLVITNEVDRANLYIARFSLLIRYALEYSDRLLTTLDNELNIIGIVVDLEQLRFSNSFVFETEIDEKIDAGKLFVPPLITQPIIENAIWHGLLPLKGLRPPKLTLKIYESNQNLHISIIDNGVGRFSGKKPIPGRESKGSKLVNSWIDNLNKLSLGNNASITITDLYDEHQQPNGTRVDLILNIKALSLLSHDKR